MHSHGFDITEIDENAFLAGPDRAQRWEEGFEDHLYRVNDIHEREIWEILEEHPANRAAEQRRRPSARIHGFQFSDHPDGVILRCPKGRIAGVYLGLHLALHATYRGRGLGTELVVERVMADGGLPGWDLDPPAYTRMGLRAHRAAWRCIVGGPARPVRETLSSLVVDLVPARPCAGSIAHA